jgi:hypothetical protein
MKKEEKFSENLKGLFLCETLCSSVPLCVSSFLLHKETQRTTEGHRV